MEGKEEEEERGPDLSMHESSLFSFSSSALYFLSYFLVFAYFHQPRDNFFLSLPPPSLFILLYLPRMEMAVLMHL